MDWRIALLAAAVGYLVGSISWARVVARIFAPEDDITVTELDIEGSDEKFRMDAVSATTVSIHHGSRLGFLTVVLDMLKVAIPTLVFKLLYPGDPHPQAYYLICAASGMVGHNWPIYHGFKGGRGLSTVWGGMFVIDWLGVLVPSIVGMFGGLLVFKEIYIAYMSGIWLLIPWLLWRFWGSPAHLIYGIAVNVIFAVASIPDIKQYLYWRKQGKVDFSETVQLTAMMRGMHRLGKRLGVFEEEPEGEEDAHAGAPASAEPPAGE
jgi:glycerol-3-phosphate acyltransferase PlsY